MRISPSKIMIGYSNVKKILNTIGIGYNQNSTKPICLNPEKISSEFYNKIRRGLYLDGYKECRKNYDYDYILTNGDT